MTSPDRRNDVSHEEAAVPGEVRRWRAFALLAVAFFMTVADLTIVNVALPTIGRKLHFPESDLQWVVTAYGLTFGGFLLLGGRGAAVVLPAALSIVMNMFSEGAERNKALGIWGGIGATAASAGLVAGGLLA